MNKGFFKFLFNLVIVLIVVWIVFAVIVKCFPMSILDEEYATYRQTKDYVNNTDEYNKVLIFGDSVAKAAISPTLISNSMYNLAMAGGTPIEQYYIMEDYLKKHEAPQTIVMMYFMGGYSTLDTFFWKRTVYFDTLSYKQFNEIIDTGLFPNSISAQIQFFQYKTAMPHKYYAAVKNGLFQRRKEINERVYNDTLQTKGQHYFGLELQFAPNNVSINNQENFKPLDIIDYYLNKCIELCIEKDIQVIIEQHPINISTYNNMKPKFMEDYIDYMSSLQKKYPAIIVNREWVIKPDDWFGDFSHLNPNGTNNYTHELNEKYYQYFN